MGRWIDWRVSEDLTATEIEALAGIVNGPLRDALPLVAKQISDERPTAPSLTARLALHYKNRVTAEYAADPQTVAITDGEVRVAGSDDRRGLKLPVIAGEYSGHTVGFQDYASIGVLAAASQVSGKVVMTGGDDIDTGYVEQLIWRLNKAGAGLAPEASFTAVLYPQGTRQTRGSAS